MTEVVVIRLLAEAEHSAFLEFGTVYQEAQPYLRPTLRFLEPLVVREVKSAWDDALASI